MSGFIKYLISFATIFICHTSLVYSDDIIFFIVYGSSIKLVKSTGLNRIICLDANGLSNIKTPIQKCTHILIPSLLCKYFH